MLALRAMARCSVIDENAVTGSVLLLGAVIGLLMYLAGRFEHIDTLVCRSAQHAPKRHFSNQRSRKTTAATSSLR
jgi:hypothetical protein